MVCVLKKISLKLNGGCIDIAYTSEQVSLIGDGFSFEFRQRSITLKNVNNVEVHVIRSGRKKVIYARYRGNMLPCRDHGETSREEISTPLFTARVTRCSLDTYLTLIFPGTFLIDYVVMSRDMVGLVLPGKREIHTEKTGNDVVIYIV